MDEPGMTETPKRPADAGFSLLDYVQISHCVTKVLIRKRFRQPLLKPELTNLKT